MPTLHVMWLVVKDRYHRALQFVHLKKHANLSNTKDLVTLIDSIIYNAHLTRSKLKTSNNRYIGILLEPHRWAMDKHFTTV